MSGIEKGVKNLSVSTDGDATAQGKEPTSPMVNERFRRRLSLASGQSTDTQHGLQQFSLDGAVQDNDRGDVSTDDSKADLEDAAAEKGLFKSFASHTQVGVVPYSAGKVNQDRAASAVQYRGKSDEALFAVYDGHGLKGQHASSYVSKHLPKVLAENKYIDTDIEKALTESCEKTNTMLSHSHVEVTFSGTTGIICYIRGKTIYTANVGDSRACLARRIDGKLKEVPLSFDLKPERPEERARIEARGGRCEACRTALGQEIGPQRVWLKKQDVPGLAMSRSFGDQVAASVGVLATPEITQHVLEENDEFIVLASDGVWEFISNQEAVDLIAKYSDPKEAALALVKESERRWRLEEEVIDDITCLIVYF